jgi:hypothetical protein
LGVISASQGVINEFGDVVIPRLTLTTLTPRLRLPPSPHNPEVSTDGVIGSHGVISGSQGVIIILADPVPDPRLRLPRLKRLLSPPRGPVRAKRRPKREKIPESSSTRGQTMTMDYRFRTQ